MKITTDTQITQTLKINFPAEENKHPVLIVCVTALLLSFCKQNCVHINVNTLC
jgi:hypothetical protein